MLQHQELIRVVIADDHRIYREGLKVLFKRLKCDNIILAGEAGSGEELIEIVQRWKPNIAITDIKMPVMNGIEATKIICKEYPETKCIALSMYNDDEFVLNMLDAGAKGYLLKNTSQEELTDAIMTVNGGSSYFSAETSIHLTRKIAQTKLQVNKVKLTKREIEVMRLICCEYSNKEIAAKLDLTIRTVESYRDHIQHKIDAKNAVGIVVYAIRNGIFEMN